MISVLPKFAEHIELKMIIFTYLTISRNTFLTVHNTHCCNYAITLNISTPFSKSDLSNAFIYVVIRIHTSHKPFRKLSTFPPNYGLISVVKKKTLLGVYTIYKNKRKAETISKVHLTFQRDLPSCILYDIQAIKVQQSEQ